MSARKTIVITGVTSGLGLGLTQYLLDGGHRVFGCGRRENPLPEADPGGFQFRSLDLMDRTALKEWADDIQCEEAIDILVHNAGAMHANANLWEIEPTDLEMTIDVNVKGSFYVARAFLPGMLEARRGVLVLMSSGAGRFGIPSISGYCASKFAVEGMAQALAEELPAPLAAIPLAPGMVDTPMLRGNAMLKADDYEKPEPWAQRAGPMILGLNREHNGQSLSVPDPD